MTATRPGLMCKSAAALSKLTLPDGSARDADAALKESGGCIDIPTHAQVEIQKRRHNTSIVTYDAGHGPQTFYVPNVDFAAPGGSVHAACLPYDKPLPIEGVVTAGKAYGEDNFGNVGWSHWLQISLPRPICTIGNAAQGQDAKSGIVALQYYSDNHVADHLVVGRRVSVVGTLDEAMTSHWSTPVFIDIQTVH